MACLAMLVLASWLDSGPRWPLDRTVTISEIQHELGNNFIAKLSRSDLSSHQAPLESMLSEIHTIRGAAAFEEWDKRWDRFFLYRNVRGRILAKWPDFGIERRHVIGPGNQVHQTIRDQGRGRYSVWSGSLYFSASDNSSPATNGRRYELSVPWFPAVARGRVAAVVRSLAFCALVLTIALALSERRWFKRVLATTLPGFSATAVMLIVLFGGFEAHQRWVRHNFADVVWPSKVDPVAGTIFEPGKELHWTNHVEFWTRSRVNSLGFLDVEPALPKPQGRFRILLVGDSMVEAVQVPLEARMQRRLAARLERRLGLDRSDVVAFGYSGTGQANQLGYYEKFGRIVAPDLVILLALSNDFANNSPILESVRNGWHPYASPRLSYERDGSDFRRVNPTVDWEKHRIGSGDAAAHYAALKQMPEFAPKLAGWGGPVERDTDAMFWQPTLPPLFEDAIVLTRRALEEWKMLAERDRFTLVVVGSNNMTPDGTTPFADRERYARRFQAVSEAVGLPYLDLYPYFAKQSDPKTAHWRIDGHWTPIGHEWAAAATYEFLVSRGFVP